jgi:hypothetical protein
MTGGSLGLLLPISGMGVTSTPIRHVYCERQAIDPILLMV